MCDLALQRIDTSGEPHNNLDALQINTQILLKTTHTTQQQQIVIAITPLFSGYLDPIRDACIRKVADHLYLQAAIFCYLSLAIVRGHTALPHREMVVMLMHGFLLFQSLSVSLYSQWNAQSSQRGAVAHRSGLWAPRPVPPPAGHRVDPFVLPVRAYPDCAGETSWRYWCPGEYAAKGDAR